MLYDKRVGQEIEVRAKALLGNASHILYGDASEEDIEEARQAVERAKHEVAQRQERDLLDMLYEWRELKSLICEAEVLSTERNKLLQEAKSLPKTNEGVSLEDCREAFNRFSAANLSAFNKAMDFRQRAYTFSCKVGGYILAMKGPKE